jgi:hypothetical protein
VPCLKRHEVNGSYYAVKKIRGKIKTHALRSENVFPITDRKIAERKLKEWLEGSEEDQCLTAAGTTFAELLARRRAA